MANFDSGVKGYIVTEATVTVKFPTDFHDITAIACKYCPYLSSNERMCQLNKQPVAFPTKFVGDDCPLHLKEDIEDV